MASQLQSGKPRHSPQLDLLFFKIHPSNGPTVQAFPYGWTGARVQLSQVYNSYNSPAGRRLLQLNGTAYNLDALKTRTVNFAYGFPAVSCWLLCCACMWVWVWV